VVVSHCYLRLYSFDRPDSIEYTGGTGDRKEQITMIPVKPRENVIPIDKAIEADFLKSVLQDREIPHVFVSYHDTAFKGVFQLQNGWGHVEVPGEYVEEVQELYREVRESKAGNDSES
jgi:hypothetical protein